MSAGGYGCCRHIYLRKTPGINRDFPLAKDIAVKQRKLELIQTS
jgi:hypothetical protein